jgi:predicted 2-oxoglutarate/Fe(II)-dependent dioxygenase YbiX
MTDLIRRAQFLAGDAVPPFAAATNLGYEVQLVSVAGRYLVLAFPGPLSLDAPRAFFGELVQLAAELHPDKYQVAAVISDTGGMPLATVEPRLLVFHDPEDAISSAYGARGNLPATGQAILWPHALILDPNLRILCTVPFTLGTSCAAAIKSAIAGLADPALHAGLRCPAPVLIAPRIFEPELCSHLIGSFADDQASESGFMVQRAGATVSEVNYAIKRRRDQSIDDPNLRALIRRNIAQRLVADMEKAFQYRPTRMDRYIVACYDAESGGYFRPHRDNVSQGTAHRRFAITINLNPDDYDGGDLRFPEFSDAVYRAPAGAAIVFSCALLHEVTPIVRGRRFAFLAFLYGEADAALREQNNAYLGDGEYRYLSGPDRLVP